MIKIGSVICVCFEPGKMPVDDSEGIVIGISEVEHTFFGDIKWRCLEYQTIESDYGDIEVFYEKDHRYEVRFVRQLTKEEMLTSSYEAVRAAALDIPCDTF